MTVLDPANDRVDVYSASLAAVAETTPNTLVLRSLQSLGLNTLKNNVAAVAPTVANDTTQGYSVGSMWIDDATGSIYVATSVAAGAAVWVPQYKNPSPGVGSAVAFNLAPDTLVANVSHTPGLTGGTPAFLASYGLALINGGNTVQIANTGGYLVSLWLAVSTVMTAFDFTQTFGIIEQNGTPIATDTDNAYIAGGATYVSTSTAIAAAAGDTISALTLFSLTTPGDLSACQISGGNLTITRIS